MRGALPSATLDQPEGGGGGLGAVRGFYPPPPRFALVAPVSGGQSERMSEVVKRYYSPALIKLKQSQAYQASQVNV